MPQQDFPIDHELVAQEAADRCAFLSLDRFEPRALGTTYRLIRVPSGYLAAWQRWIDSAAAVRARERHAARAQ